ncbi:ARPP-1 family domain-containing protein [Desulfatirhabdium butyrativorans]|uniref:ARPP-1 family domain-containing protein n=1 Tax=Desulfatirhabdium butyrativorans TaxID=340467 RepID=UPI0003FC8CA4|nr:DUF6569 family protein [Desulfatirhabdium butyrativorans]
METILTRYFNDIIRMGDLSIHQDLAIVPLYGEAAGGPEYITLKTALASGLTITEVNEGGSVPELKVTNLTGKHVLIIDGEEVAGAKQNRVLNTSILIAAGASLVIPVSCTEHGRWGYRSDRFEDSDVCMSPSLRSRKNLSVSHSLQSSGRYRADQGVVWEGIAELHHRHGTHSGTGAMKDAYERKRRSNEDYQQAFPCLEGQCGMVVLIRGRVVGLEMVSRPEIYRQLHDKLINSYAMDIPMSRPGQSGPAMIKVEKILERIREAKEERFPSVGVGEDRRYTARELMGSALVVDDWIVHLAFFRTDHSGHAHVTADRMASLGRRRAFHTRNF